MLDVFNIPGQQDNVKVFYANGTTAWQTWQKPRNCKFIWIMCIGAGNGGAGGPNANLAASSQAGGSGAVTRALFSANTLPDTLFIQSGVGGTSGAAGASPGGIGGRSWVAISQVTSSVMNVVCTSGIAPASFNLGESAATTTQAGLLSLGNITTTAGQAQTANQNLSPFTTTIVTAGVTCQAGGPIAGYSILATPISPLLPGGLSGGGDGSGGLWSWKPMFGLGGTGGGSSNTGVGGKGGNGSYGCGGGSGGGSSTTGGIGGRGGDGLVIIVTF